MKWVKSDNLAATREGWVLSATGEKGRRPFQLQRLDWPAHCLELDYDEPVFDDDFEAWIHVVLNPTPLHQRALCFLAEHSAEEYTQIMDYVIFEEPK